jgi:hypothetical protein
MPNALEQRGFFWWFNEPDIEHNSKETSIPGLLTVTADGHTTLQIDGALCEKNEYSAHAAPCPFPIDRRIAGILDTSEKYVLLEGLERSDFFIEDESPQTQTITAEICTRRFSEFPLDYLQCQFTELRIEMKGLEDWLLLDSLIVERDYTDDEKIRAQVSYREVKISFPCPGGSISIESLTTGIDPGFLLSNREQRSVLIEQSFYIVFRSDIPTDLQYLQFVFAKVEELIALLLGSYYRLTRPMFVRKEQSSDEYITIFYPRDAPSEEAPPRFFYLIPFGKIQHCFGDLFTSWLSGSETFGAGFYLYVASLRNPHVYIEDRLFNLTTGIEALHRREHGESADSLDVTQQKERVRRILGLLPKDDPDHHWLAEKLAYAHEPSLRNRVLQCLRELPFQFGEGELEKFAKTCANRRNDISHGGGPRGNLDYNTFYLETTRLAEALGHFFHAILLHKVGVPDDVLLETWTRGFWAEFRIKPALASVGLTIKSKTEN